MDYFITVIFDTIQTTTSCVDFQENPGYDCYTWRPLDLEIPEKLFIMSATERLEKCSAGIQCILSYNHGLLRGHQITDSTCCDILNSLMNDKTTLRLMNAIGAAYPGDNSNVRKIQLFYEIVGLKIEELSAQSLSEAPVKWWVEETYGPLVEASVMAHRNRPKGTKRSQEDPHPDSGRPYSRQR